MLTFFNEIVAARLQYVTFPLELVGFSLALIEVRFPKAAAYLTRHVERLATPMRDFSGDHVTMERSLEAFLSRLLKAGLTLFVLAYLAQLGYRMAMADWHWTPGFAELLSFLIVGVVLTIVLALLGLVTFFLVTGSSEFARRFVAGRAIGTLGILIAGLGLLGELYQLMTQLLH